MSDREQCNAFGTTVEDVDADVRAFENGDWERFRFGDPAEGKPDANMTTAIVRRACGNELVAWA